jgi:hypothetical protein
MITPYPRTGIWRQRGGLYNREGEGMRPLPTPLLALLALVVFTWFNMAAARQLNLIGKWHPFYNRQLKQKRSILFKITSHFYFRKINNTVITFTNSSLFLYLLTESLKRRYTYKTS